MVENYSKADGVVTIEVEPKFTVYIACCYEATLVINGKCNGVVFMPRSARSSSTRALPPSRRQRKVKVQCKGICPSHRQYDGILTRPSKATPPVTSFSRPSPDMVSLPNDGIQEAPIPDSSAHAPLAAARSVHHLSTTHARAARGHVTGSMAWV